jgi:hypothetical protein
MNPLFLAIGAVALLWFLSNQSGASVQQPAITGGGSAGTIAGNGLDNIEQGIANFENVNPAYNNPGAVQAGRTPYPGQTGVAGNGLAIFADQGDGWTQFDALLRAKVANNPDWDYYDLAGNWVNGNSVNMANNADNEAESVASYVGVAPTSSLAAIGNNQ